jgi:hypothetical protein
MQGRRRFFDLRRALMSESRDVQRGVIGTQGSWKQQSAATGTASSSCATNGHRLSTEQSGVDCRPWWSSGGSKSPRVPPFAGRRRGHVGPAWRPCCYSVKSIAVAVVSAEGRDPLDRRSQLSIRTRICKVTAHHQPGCIIQPCAKVNGPPSTTTQMAADHRSGWSNEGLSPLCDGPHPTGS